MGFKLRYISQEQAQSPQFYTGCPNQSIHLMVLYPCEPYCCHGDASDPKYVKTIKNSQITCVSGKLKSEKKK